MEEKVDLSQVPELSGHTVVTTREELETFFSRLRQDWYSAEEMKKGKTDFFQALELWKKSAIPGTTSFFLVEDEPDDFAKNDDWGRFRLYQCLVIRMSDDSLKLSKFLLEEFWH